MRSIVNAENPHLRILHLDLVVGRIGFYSVLGENSSRETETQHSAANRET
jgi:hypothetical protein